MTRTDLVFAGFPVYRDYSYTGHAYALGYLRRRIVLGRSFDALYARQRHAILLHEAEHLIRRHGLKRLVRALLPPLLAQHLDRPWLHELAADQAVIDAGFGHDLADVLRGLPSSSSGSFLRMDRIRRLTEPKAA